MVVVYNLHIRISTPATLAMPGRHGVAVVGVPEQGGPPKAGFPATVINSPAYGASVGTRLRALDTSKGWDNAAVQSSRTAIYPSKVVCPCKVCSEK